MMKPEATKDYSDCEAYGAALPMGLSLHIEADSVSAFRAALAAMLKYLAGGAPEHGAAGILPGAKWTLKREAH